MTEESVESLAQRFRYTGREFDALTGLYHYRARAYDPETARFLQEDPLHFEAFDLNVYRYVANDPVDFSDPSGESIALLYVNRAANGAAAGALIGAGFSTLGCTYSVLSSVIEKSTPVTSIQVNQETCLAEVTDGAIKGAAVGAGLGVIGVATGQIIRGVFGKPLRNLLFGKAGILNGGSIVSQFFRIGYGKHEGQVVVRVAGTWVQKIAGKAHVDIMNVGSMKDLFK